MDDGDDDRQWILELIHYNRIQATRLQKQNASKFLRLIRLVPLPAIPRFNRQRCWDHCLRVANVRLVPCLRQCLGGHLIVWRWVWIIRLWELERSAECFEKILADPKLQLQLPKSGCLPGTAMKHSIDLAERTIQQQWPVVYKIGFTHCPHTRFHNSKFGYAVDMHQQWQTMVILFASHESVGPSFVEAALIQKFKGTLHAA